MGIVIGSIFFFLFSFESSQGPRSWQPRKSQPLPLNVNPDITNHFNDHEFPVGLITRLVKELHQYWKGQGSNPIKPELFQVSFCNCISCFFDCINCLCIYFFAAQLQFMNFIKSPLFLSIQHDARMVSSSKWLKPLDLFLVPVPSSNPPPHL